MEIPNSHKNKGYTGQDKFGIISHRICYLDYTLIDLIGFIFWYKSIRASAENHYCNYTSVFNILIFSIFRLGVQ